MSKTALALAAALLATSTLSSAANAGGLRVGLGFGFPLGNFVAHERQSDTGRSYSKPDYHKPAAVARSHDNDPPVRHAKRAAPKVETADAPARKVKRAAPKVDVAEAPAPRPRKLTKVLKPAVQDSPEVKTAKLEDTATVTDATPSIYVPEAPAAADSNLAGTQSTPAVTRTALVTPETAAGPTAATTATEPAPVEAAKIEKLEEPKTAEVKSEPEGKKVVVPATVKRLCRRFSAAVASLIDVPCE